LAKAGIIKAIKRSFFIGVEMFFIGHNKFHSMDTAINIPT
jgi:hypothetical protein